MRAPPGLLYYYDDIKNTPAAATQRGVTGYAEAWDIIMRQVRTLGLLGTGVIGGGWAARALHFGIDVVAAGVKPPMEGGVGGAVGNAEGGAGRRRLAT